MSQPTCRFNGFIVPSISEYVCTDENGHQVSWFSNQPPNKQKPSAKSLPQKSPADYLEDYIAEAHDDVMFLDDKSPTLYEKCQGMKEDLDELTKLDPNRGTRMSSLHYDVPCKARVDLLGSIDEIRFLGRNIVYIFWTAKLDPLIFFEDTNESISSFFGRELYCADVEKINPSPVDEMIALDLFE